MPEGDSLHRTAARLQPLVGRRLTASSPHPRGLVTGVAAAVDGRRLESVEAIGKHLSLAFEGGITIRSHLRTSGRWHVGKAGSNRVGRPWLVLRSEELEATQWNGPVLTLDQRALRRVGPDLLAAGTDPPAVVLRLRRADRRRPVGEVLQDQSLVAGIGNMWMSEALWVARVSPEVPLGAVSDAELLAALRWAQAVMRGSVTGRRPDRAVYRRRGRPCRLCGGVILARGQGDQNRTAYWCPACQRGSDPGTA